MRIGLTYDLRDDYRKLGYDEQQVAEFDRPDTIRAVEKALRAMGHKTDRIGRVQKLTERLAKFDRWDLVFNIAEGLSSTGISREAQVPTLLDLHDIPYTFSDPLVCSLTLHKALCKLAVRGLGLPTPDFAVVPDQAAIGTVELPFPVFAKPVAEGSSKGISAASKVHNREELAVVCCALLERYRQPVLVETFLPGRELTVGIVGTGERAEALGALEVHLQPAAEPEVYSFANKEKWQGAVKYSIAEGPIAEEACTLALAVWRGLGCRDGGRVDLRADASGRLNFLEVNVLPGLRPGYSDLPMLAEMRGVSFSELIRRIVDSALLRIPAQIREVKPLKRTRAAKPAAKKRGKAKPKRRRRRPAPARARR